jgi:predicted DNA-binding transcriptional regulator YafY
MRRAERLFQIIQILRRHRRAVTADAIAAELEVSVRTVYRDVAELIGQRVPIEGAAGVGYLLRGGFDLPPLMFTEDELEALLIGARIVDSWADPALGRAARDVLAKIAAVVPERLRPRVASLALAAPPISRRPEIGVDMATLRRWTREEGKVRLVYVDLKDAVTERVVWPMTLAFFPPVWLLLGWCELRRDFRSFRLERTRELAFLDDRYPQEPGKRLVDYLGRVGYQPRL